MNLPLVSVIIPVFNTEEYLEKCVESIICQTYQQWEIILVDDGSTDGSPAVCDTYGDMYDNIKVIHKKNEGQGIARNIGLEICRGKYVCFVDSDDSVKPDMLERLVRSCEAKSLDICICGYEIDTGIRKVQFCPEPRLLNHESLMKEYILTPDIGGGPCNKIYNRNLFSELRFPALRANEDAYLMPEIFLKCGRAAIISAPLYIQYLRRGSTERSEFTDRKYAIICADAHLKEIIKENYPELYQYVQLRVAESIYNLMFKALDSAKSAKKDMHFPRLLEMLAEETDKVEKEDKVYDRHRLHFFKDIVRYPQKEAAKLKVKVFKKRIYDQIKRAVYILKRCTG